MTTTTEDYEGPAHLRPLDPDIVKGLCAEAMRVAPFSNAVRLEADGFLRDRTPWDAKRLANALEHTVEPSSEITALIQELRKL